MMKVAIVDDVQLNLTLMQHLVRRIPECEAVCFLQPEQALAWCLDHEPELVVVDFMMPGMSGIELTLQLHAVLPELPVLMITANHETALRHQALEAGVTDFLTKPIDKAEFLARCRNMLALSSSRRQLARRADWLADEVHKATQALAEQAREAVVCLSRAAEYRDPETGAHLQRMSHYARLIAAELGLPASDQELLLQAAPMHDVGKVGTPDHILLKPGRLTPDEFAVMKQHAQIGYEVLRTSSSFLLQVAAQIAYTHHEKFDGSGYPRGLAGEDIPLFGRITAVADVFDALTSARPYKAAWPLERAAELLREERGRHFDPSCVDAFFARWDEVLAIRARYLDEEDLPPPPRASTAAAPPSPGPGTVAAPGVATLPATATA